METKIAIRYTGPAVDAGTMDVYQVSANMIAFSDFVVQAAKVVYGESVSASASVAGFGKGSFVTDIVFNVSGAVVSLFSMPLTPKDLLEALKQSIEIWKHLKGSPAKKAEPVDGGQRVNIENNSGNVIQVSTQSLNLVLSDRASQAVEQFVNRALQPQGMDSVQIDSEVGGVASISQKESSFFVPVASAEQVTDVTVKMALTIEAPVFKEGNKWRFSDGDSTFYAGLVDEAFLARVNDGERFGKGDILMADVRISQEQTGMKLNAQRTIVKVHEHKHAARQLALPGLK